jgi:predicted dehydrogenase
MTNQLGVGVLGLHEGRTLLVALNHPTPPNVGQTPADAQPRAQYARAVAGCDLRDEKLAAARHDVPDIFYTSDYAEMLAREDVQIVAIYTPDHLHGEHIVQAFEAGKHVICTKPIVNSVADAERVLEAAQRTGRKLLVGQSTRFFESFRRQRHDYEQGSIGTLEMLDAHYVHRMDWFYDKSTWALNATDWVYAGLSHPLDLARWYLGPIEEVHAYRTRSALAKQYNAQSYDMYIVNLISRSGKLGRVMGHYGVHELASARNAIECMLYGSAGSSMAQYHDMRYYHTAADGTEVQHDLLYAYRAYHFNNEVHGMHYGEFANYTDYFARSILQDVPHSPNLLEGIETFYLMEAVKQSAAQRQPMRVQAFTPDTQ